jgi:hypothetical protein
VDRHTRHQKGSFRPAKRVSVGNYQFDGGRIESFDAHSVEKGQGRGVQNLPRSVGEHWPYLNKATPYIRQAISADAESLFSGVSYQSGLRLFRGRENLGRLFFR